MRDNVRDPMVIHNSFIMATDRTYNVILAIRTH